MAEIFDDFRALVKKDPAAVKRWVDYTNATSRMNAAAPLAATPVAAGAAANLSDLYLSLQGTANQHIMDFQDRQNANRAALVAQAAAESARLSNAHNQAQSSLQELAQRLGISDALVGKPEASANDNWARLQEASKVNTNNQLNSVDSLRQGYGEVMGNEAAGYDQAHAQALSDLYSQITAAGAGVPGSGGSSSGGSGGSGRSGSSRSGGSGGSGGSKKTSTSAIAAADAANPGVWVMKQNDPDVQYAQHWSIMDPSRRDKTIPPPTAAANAARRRLQQLKDSGDYATGSRH